MQVIKKDVEWWSVMKADGTKGFMPGRCRHSWPPLVDARGTCSEPVTALVSSCGSAVSPRPAGQHSMRAEQGRRSQLPPDGRRSFPAVEPTGGGGRVRSDCRFVRPFALCIPVLLRDSVRQCDRTLGGGRGRTGARARASVGGTEGGTEHGQRRQLSGRGLGRRDGSAGRGAVGGGPAARPGSGLGRGRRRGGCRHVCLIDYCR